MTKHPKVQLCDVISGHTRLLNRVADDIERLSTVLFEAGNQQVSDRLTIYEDTLRRAARDLREAHSASVGADFADATAASKTMLEAMITGVAIGRRGNRSKAGAA